MMLHMASADPQSFSLWKATDLKTHGKQLATLAGSQQSASETLAEFGHYYAMLAYREVSGGAELHQNTADIFVIQSGEATVVVGGAIGGSHTIDPGEIRGTEIDGGETHRVSAGDVVHIPANTPHQMLLEPDQRITYFVIKVQSR